MSRIAVGGMSLLDKCIHVDQTCLVKILSNIHDMSDEKHVANLYISRFKRLDLIYVCHWAHILGRV